MAATSVTTLQLNASVHSACNFKNYRSSIPPIPCKPCGMQIRCQAEEKQTGPDGPTATPVAPPQPAVQAPSPPKPKVSTKFFDVLVFSSPTPERINGRLAMIGFVAAIGAELARGDDVAAQLSNGGFPWFFATTVIFSTMSPVPLFKG